jgi:hypothetical protein
MVVTLSLRLERGLSSFMNRLRGRRRRRRRRRRTFENVRGEAIG